MARSQAPWMGSCRSPRRPYHAAPGPPPTFTVHESCWRARSERPAATSDAQHSADDAVVPERVIDGAADVHRRDREEPPARPQVDVGEEDVELLVLVAPVRQVDDPPQ